MTHKQLRERERRRRQIRCGTLRTTPEETPEEREARLERNRRKVERKALAEQIAVNKSLAPKTFDRRARRAIKLLKRYGISELA